MDGLPIWMLSSPRMLVGLGGREDYNEDVRIGSLIPKSNCCIFP